MMITKMVGVILILVLLILLLKLAKKYTHNMILMSRYKGQLHGGKRAKKFGQGPPPGGVPSFVCLELLNEFRN